MTLKPRLRKPSAYDFAQALERAARAAVVAFVGVYPAQSLYEALGGTAPVDVDLAKKAALAAGMAAIAFLWRWLLPDVGRSQPIKTADVPVLTHPHGSDVATDA